MCYVPMSARRRSGLQLVHPGARCTTGACEGEPRWLMGQATLPPTQRHGEGKGHTLDPLDDWNGATASLQPETTSIRCAICERRSSGPLYRVVESIPLDDDPRSWLLCVHCATAVRQEVERADLRTPLRVRIAVGIVALQRRSRHYHFWNEQFWEEDDDEGQTRIVKWFIFGLVIFKTLFIVFVIAYVVVSQGAH
jgi:hypothetical protein